MKDTNVSVILPAYKETGLPKLVRRILSERIPTGFKLDSVIVVACECNDATLRAMPKSPKLKVLRERTRLGKAASVNSALEKANADVIVLESADTTPARGALAKLLEPLADSHVGMTTARPVPTNDGKTFLGFLVCTVWSMHHLVSLRRPKGGEMIAFRNTIGRLPPNTVADESYIERSVSCRGLQVMYVPDAAVYNKGPSTLSGFFEQRRRVFSGHIQAISDFGYAVSTTNAFNVAAAALSYARGLNAKQLTWFVAAALIEAAARIAGTLDFYMLGRISYMWESTK